MRKYSPYARKNKAEKMIYVDPTGAGLNEKENACEMEMQDLKEAPTETESEPKPKGSQQEVEMTGKKHSCQGIFDAVKTRVETQGSSHLGTNFKKIDQIKEYVAKTQTSCCFTTGIYIARFFQFLSFLSLTCIPICLAGYSYIPIWAGAFIGFIILIRFLQVERAFLIADKKKIDAGDSSESLKNYLLDLARSLGAFNELAIESWVPLVFMFITIIALTTFFNTSCVSFHDSPLVVSSDPILNLISPGFGSGFWAFSYTNAFIRRYKLGSDAMFNCYNLPGPCHVYMTLGFDASRDVFVNMHLPVNITSDDVEVYYETLDEFYFLGHASNKATLWKFHELKDRNFLSMRIQKLNPSTEYQINVRVKQHNYIRSEKDIYRNITIINYMPKPYDQNQMLNFKTLPDSAESNLNMVFAGTIGSGDKMKEFFTNNVNLKHIDLLAFK